MCVHFPQNQSQISLTHTCVFIQLETWCTDSSSTWQLCFNTPDFSLSLGLTQAHMRLQTNWALNLAQLCFTGACSSSRCWKTSCHKTKEGEANPTDCMRWSAGPQRPAANTSNPALFSPTFVGDESNVFQCETLRVTNGAIKDIKRGQSPPEPWTASYYRFFSATAVLIFGELYSWGLWNRLKPCCFK